MKNKKLTLATILTLGIGLTGLFAQTDKITETLTDIDGNIYKTIKIGTQVWMAENLKTTRYCKGDSISTTRPATLDIRNESLPKYQWVYEGDESYESANGRLYTWYTATDSLGLCPVGWHVPMVSEWSIMIDFLGGEDISGGKLKEIDTIYWNRPNVGATNESGFAALASGYRGFTGSFYNFGNQGNWWTSSDGNSFCAPYRYIRFDGHAVNYDCGHKIDGFSVRCLRD